MAFSLLALGSNRGDRSANLCKTCSELSKLPRSQLLARSRWYPTDPVGGPDGQDSFLNGAVILQTALTPLELATCMHQIEERLGRQRDVRWDARVIDIDMLLYDDLQMELPNLTLPHPRMVFRKFVLEPAAEIAGDWTHPHCGWTLSRLLSNLEGTPRRILFVSSQDKLLDWLAEELAKFFDYTRCSLSDDFSHAALASRLGLSSWKAIELSTLLIELPSKGGKGSATISNSDSDAFFVMGLLPREGEHASADSQALSPGNEQSEKNILEKNKKNIFGQTPNFSEIQLSAPVSWIRTNDRKTILQEAVAAIGSAWPDLTPTNISAD